LKKVNQIISIIKEKLKVIKEHDLLETYMLLAGLG